MTSFPRSPLHAARLAALLMASLLPLLFVSCSDDNNPVTPPYEYADLEQQTFAKVNAYRVSIGKPALAWSDVVLTQARQHSTNMAAKTVAFGHDGFSDRAATIGNTVPWSNAGENVAMMSGQTDPATSAVEAWLKSPGHKANIEGDYNRTAMGIAKAADGSLYFTQIFIKAK